MQAQSSQRPPGGAPLMPLALRPLCRGRYRARLADGAADVAAAIALRRLAFRTRRGRDAPEEDALDPLCQHMLIEDTAAGGGLVSCFRLMPFEDGRGLGQGYAARHYDLTALAGFAGPLLELGRFCLHPDHHDPDILRLGWGALARLVDGAGVQMLVGCSSFPGADPLRHGAALAHLAQHSLAPARWAPRAMAARTYPFAALDLPAADGPAQALAGMPPLLRTYLMMGGWVSDHAVIDTDLDTLHVFTAVEIAAIPPARARALRAIAA